MSWLDWFDVDVIRHVFRHVSGTIVAVVLFFVAAWVVKELVPVSARNYIERVEHVVLIGLLVFLALQLFLSLIKALWNQIRGGWNGTQLLAV